jgi:MFS family permease
MITSAYPQLIQHYGVVASLLFSLSYSTFGIYAGLLSHKFNRSILLGVSCILWSLTSYFSGAINSFALFCLMRFLLGVFESACNPASYSIIADYFPPSYRSTANAIETSGSYIGQGLSALSILVISKSGWRSLYQYIGILGVLSGLI